MADTEPPVYGPGTKTEVAVLEPAAGPMLVPSMIAGAGGAPLRFIDFFTANIRKPKHGRGLCHRRTRLLRLARAARPCRARRDSHAPCLGLY
jgi:hypothetical protein